MKKRSLIILSISVVIITVSAFGITKDSTPSFETESKPQTDSTIIELSDFGIGGEINIDIRTGKKIEFTASNKKQNLFYMVRGFTNQGFYRPITQEKIKNAKTLNDIIEHYPSNWISNYNSVVISTIINGKEYEVKGLDATLTKKQKELFNSAAISSNILINVHYQKKNEDNKIQNRQMNVSLVIVPKTEAKFIGGYDHMIAYFEKNSMEKIQNKNFKLLPQASISFIINESGKPENITIDSSYNDVEIDNMLVNLVKKMQKWVPAKNAKGELVKQKFVLDIGPDGC